MVPQSHVLFYSLLTSHHQRESAERVKELSRRTCRSGKLTTLLQRRIKDYEFRYAFV